MRIFTAGEVFHRTLPSCPYRIFYFKPIQESNTGGRDDGYPPVTMLPPRERWVPFAVNDGTPLQKLSTDWNGIKLRITLFIYIR